MPVLALIGGKMQADAADKAGQLGAEAANQANQKQWEMYQQNRTDQEPWRQAGVGALGEMGGADFKRDFTMSDFSADPGYAFRMAEGQKALERSAAARGGLNSGATMKALSRYGQDVASQEYQNAYNRFNADRDRRFGRLGQLAGFGQNATQMNAAGAANYADAFGKNTMYGANVKGNAGMAGASAWGDALKNIWNMGKDAASMYAKGGA